MKKKLLLVSLIPAIASAVLAAPALAATKKAASENWAGYVVTAKNGDKFSSVSAQWTQPTVTCTSNTGESTYSAYWVGLGGGDQSSDALEQIGTQADCSTSGTAKYYAWYELVPSAPVKVPLTIHANDKVYARTSVSGDQVSFYIIDRTTGQSWSKTLAMTSTTPDTSTAEWVTEAPSECAGSSTSTSECTPLPLANFGTATFADAYATSDGHTGSITDSRWSATAIELEPSDSSVFGSGPGGYFGGGYGGGYSEFSSYSAASDGAAPTGLSDKGTKFQVKYGKSLSGVSSTSTQTQSSGAYSTDSGGGYGYYGGSGYGYYGGAGYGYGSYGYGYGSYGYGYGSYGYGYGGDGF
jgi:hypothetical protein